MVLTFYFLRGFVRVGGGGIGCDMMDGYLVEVDDAVETIATSTAAQVDFYFVQGLVIPRLRPPSHLVFLTI